MRHDVVLEGFNCRLRPVRTDDAEFIITVRSQGRAAGKINATSSSVLDQVAWIERYFQRDDDYYWIVEDVRTGTPIGTIGLYDFTPDGAEAMPGRWVMMPQTEVSALAPVCLMYDFAFLRLGIKRVVISVIPDNHSILRFVKLYGAHPSEVPPRYVQHERETGVSQKWFELTSDDWRASRTCLTPLLETF